MDDMDLVSLFCSRICHDLISPVGAVSNGLELIEEEDPRLAERPEMRLAALSAARAADGIAFFRLAFGGSGGDPVEIEALARIAARHLSSERLTVEGPSTSGRLSRDAARLALMLALTAASALPRGGRLVLSASSGRPKEVTQAVERVTVEARGPVLKLRPEAQAAIEDLRPPENARPRDAHLVALTRLALKTGALISLTVHKAAEGDGGMVFTAVAPLSRDTDDPRDVAELFGRGPQAGVIPAR